MHHSRRFGAMTLIILFSSALEAADPAPPREALGEETRRWLDLQRSGVAASPHPQTLSGPVADVIHKRYVDSFGHPIPDFYKVERGAGNSGSSQ